MQKVLPKIISHDQQGFIKNRFIGNNIRQIEDVINYTENFGIDCAVLFLDFKKAFDTVDWNFMFAVLKKFGFSDSFINWIKIMYTNISSCIMNNGWRSSFFKISRGVRQGCPLSALIYLTVAEILALKIRQSNNINGITLNLNDDVKQIKITQLADDTTLFLSDEGEVTHAVSILDEFEVYSGLKLNKNKSEGLWVGKSKYKTNNVDGINFTNKHVKALGVYFGNDKHECDRFNWESKLESCTKTLNFWKCRRLTFYGRILLLKSQILSKLNYLIQSISLSSEIENKLNSLFFNFLWDGKSEKIKRNTLIGNKEDGGLDMVDIKSHIKILKMKWVSSLNDTNEANWKLIPRFYLNQYGNNLLVFSMNIDSFKSLPKVKHHVPNFYLQIVKNFIEFKNTKPQKSPDTFWEIRQQIIWGNKFIKSNGKTIIFKSWIDSGILFINDIISQDGKICSDTVLPKLKTRHNWVSEIYTLTRSIPSAWKTILKSSSSTKTKVNTDISISINGIKLKHFTNSELRNLHIKNIFIKPYVHKYWDEAFKKKINWKSYYFILNKVIPDNTVKQFKFKLIHRILPTNENLFIWKLSDSPLCKFCNALDSYEHFFIKCNYLTSFWAEVTSIFHDCKYHKSFKTLENLAIGYKIDYHECNFINIILSQIAYTIYKTYLASEKRTKQLNILNFLYVDMLVLSNYFEKKNIEHYLIKKFVTHLQHKVSVNFNHQTV
jgi:hypothetical protein